MFSRKKGMVYTMFVVIVMTTIIAFINFNITTRNTTVDESLDRMTVDNMYYFIEGTIEDFERSSYISAKRGVISLIDIIAAEGNYSNDSKTNIESFISNGFYNGSVLYLMENSTLSSCNQTIISIGNKKNFESIINFTNVDINSYSYDKLQFNVSLDITVFGNNGKIRLKRTKNVSTFINFQKLEDPFVTINSYGYLRKLIVSCNTTKYPYHAKNILNGTNYNGTWTSGTAYISDGTNLNLITDRSNKILILSDIPEPTPPEISDFSGIISENATDNNITGTYVYGAYDALTNITNNSLVVINNSEIWINNILDELIEGCYFKDIYGPTFLDRLEGNFNTSQKYNSTLVSGIGSFIDVSTLPAELQEIRSDIDFIYFDETQTDTTYSIMGVTDKCTGYSKRSWFRLDQKHVDLWGLESIVY
ncbi:MAG: hypothetical protein K0B02_03095 [DPANN group archaeon]|nr:hypothetical protein [DPANN group archaeon]